MTTDKASPQGVTLREALENLVKAYDDFVSRNQIGGKEVPEMTAARKVIAASKLDPSADDIHLCSPFCKRPQCVADREAEPQAQAGEPEVVAWAVYQLSGDHTGTVLHEIFFTEEDANRAASFLGEFWHGTETLITLQSHREAIAKKDAALRRIKYEAVSLAEAQVIALEALK